MICPYCLKSIHFTRYGNAIEFRQSPPAKYHAFEGGFCPACGGLTIIDLSEIKARRDGSSTTDEEYDRAMIYPNARILEKLPADVPLDYSKEFDEARLVIDVSAKSSAALCRRLLQRILHEKLNMKKPCLQQEINEFISVLGPPTHLKEKLDAIRVVGNFGAHPIKDTNTGEITDVEEGEAELLIETLESLFDFVFVQPAKWTAAKSALNTKLAAAGKPLIP